ncbi:MAG: hypothetical protein H5U08_12140 [Thermogutta sp.]|uniref:HEAT repeat domain-containing protein n=1 Tax=Thermogutta sp. TaxID=1962930 RepID=UPI0019A1EEAA|nr:HEAT repeat domain-containing protein [Thermogutta sp.]MBC7353101.1 hypothetical protein [Thermogutta sp.]
MNRKYSPRIGGSVFFSLGILGAVCLGMLVAESAGAQPRGSAPPGAQPGAPPPTLPGLPGIPGLPGTAPQQPEEKPVPPAIPNYLELSTDDSLAKQAGTIQRMLRDGNFSAVANGQQLFQDYYEKYFFPNWTKASNRSRLQQLRSQLIVSDLGNAARGGGPPRDLLLQIAFRTLSDYAQNNQLDPAVRVSAVLAIGELNERERPTGGGMQPPTPLPAALPFLLNLIQDANQPDALRLAALVGLERHCACGIPDANTRDQQVIPLLRKLAGDKNVPAERDPRIHEWFRVRAIDVLAATRQAGANGENVKFLVGFVSDENEAPSVRLAAASALGNLDYSQVQGVSPLAVVQSLGKMVLDLCVADIQSASQSGSWDSLKPRKIAQYVGCAQQGIRGVRSMLTGKPEDQLVGKFNTALDGITKALNDSASARDPASELVRLLPPALNTLNTALQSLGASAGANGGAAPAGGSNQPAS